MYLEQDGLLEYHIIQKGLKIIDFSMTVRRHLETDVFYYKDLGSIFFWNVCKFL